MFALFIVQVIAYHDPDLNYHINQLQAQSLNTIAHTGYNYPVPAVQLTTSGIKVVGASQILPPPSYTYSQPQGYTAQVVSSPQVSYAVPTNINYIQSSAITTQKEFHGYSTSAGLSSYTGARRTVTPQATYARAPIIAKITAAPLIAKYAPPTQSSLLNQNLISHIDNPVNPVVSQVIAAPSVRYAASPALRPQTQFVNNNANIESTQATVAQYRAPVKAQYAQALSQFVPPPPAPFTEALVTKNIPVPDSFRPLAPLTHFSSAIPRTAVPAEYSAPAVAYFPPPTALQPVIAAHGTHIAPAPITKNVHTEFLENYVSI